MYGHIDEDESWKCFIPSTPEALAEEERRRKEDAARDAKLLEEIVGNGKEVSFIPMSQHPLLSRMYCILPGRVYRVILKGTDSAMPMTFEGILARCDGLARKDGFTPTRIELTCGFFFDPEERYVPFDRIALYGQALENLGEFRELNVVLEGFKRKRAEKTGL
jgi:hypothetical protein